MFTETLRSEPNEVIDFDGEAESDEEVRITYTDALAEPEVTATRTRPKEAIQRSLLQPSMQISKK